MAMGRIEKERLNQPYLIDTIQYHYHDNEHVLIHAQRQGFLVQWQAADW